MGVCFLHTADWQIGKAFGNFPEGARAALAARRIEAVRDIARIAAEAGAEAVLVAGDVFETPAVGDETLRRTLVALEPFPGPWVLLPGNHDPALAESPWTRIRRLTRAENIILATEPRPVEVPAGRLTVFPAPLQRRREIVDLTDWFDDAEAAPGSVRVGLAHGSVSGYLPAEAEAGNPIAADRAVRAGLDYLALGDWHGTLPIEPRTWYSGTPEPDRFRANEPGQVLIVRIEAPGALPQVERRPTGRFHWHQTASTIHNPEDVEALRAEILALAAPLESAVVRMNLDGAPNFRTRLRLDETLDDLRARMLSLEVDDARLVPEPGEDDLDQIDTLGFVRTAIDALRTRAANPADPDREVARHALQILYLAHRKGG